MGLGPSHGLVPGTYSDMYADCIYDCVGANENQQVGIIKCRRGILVQRYTVPTNGALFYTLLIAKSHLLG